MKASHPLSRLISTSLDYHFKGVSRAKFMETLASPPPVYRCERSRHAALVFARRLSKGKRDEEKADAERGR